LEISGDIIGDLWISEDKMGYIGRRKDELQGNSKDNCWRSMDILGISFHYPRKIF
jgi:hypothetical protein